MTDSPTIRPAQLTDQDAILELLPQLADFDVPEKRNPRHLWEGDAALVQKLLAGEPTDSFCDVAVSDDVVQAVILVTMREEIMSHAPSAHLEAIVVHPDARGLGLGQRMLAHCEERVRALGAKSLSLHVFANNQRARGLYRANGFDEELIRDIKWLE